jgi:hypothetical protein
MVDEAPSQGVTKTVTISNDVSIQHVPSSASVATSPSEKRENRLATRTGGTRYSQESMTSYVAGPENVLHESDIDKSAAEKEEEEPADEDILALLTFTAPSWFEEILAGTGIMTLQYNIQQERIKRNDEFYTNPYPITAAIVTSNYFDALVAFIVGMNCLVLGIEVSLTDEEMAKEASTFELLEYIFSIGFFLEWCLRLVVFGWSWPFEFANAADTFLVFGTGVFLKPLTILGVDNSGLRILTALRILRLVRTARAVRLLPAFKEMWILLHGLMTSVQPLAWVAVIAVVVLYVFSVAACELIGRRPPNPAWAPVMALLDNNSDGVLTEAELINATASELAILREEFMVRDLFGDLTKSMLTMLQLMTLDTWGDSIAREVEGEGGQALFVQLFCIAFIGVGVFVFWNLITAVVVGSALKIYDDDAAQQAKDMDVKKRQELMQLKDLFLEMDSDKSGNLSKSEFFSQLKLKHMQETLVMLDMKEEDMTYVWSVLDDGDGELSIKEFTDGIRRMKGEAKAKDVQDVIKRLRETTHRQKELRKDVEQFVQTVKMIRTVADNVQDDTDEVIALLTEMYQRLDWYIVKGERNKKGAKKGTNAKFTGAKLPEKFHNYETKKAQLAAEAAQEAERNVAMSKKFESTRLSNMMG